MKVWSARLLFRLFAAALACCVMVPSVLAGQSQASKKTTSSQAGTTSSTSTGATVDLNSATEKELESLPGVGSATAKKIIAGRPYSSVDDLSKAGVSSRTIAKIAPLVTVSGGVAAPSAKATAKAPPPVSQPAPAVPSQAAPPAPAAAAPAVASQGVPGAGMVWVNLDSGVYHYQNSRYYGKTKNGKYMSEADAMKAGYHAAKNEKKPQ